METPLNIRHVLVVVAGIVASLIPATLTFNVWAIFVVPVCSELDVATNQFTFYVTVIFLAAAVSAPFIGNLMEKYDMRIIATVSVLLCSVGILGGAFYQEVWQFYFSGAIEGMGVATLNFLMIPTVINRWFHTHTGALIGVCMAMTGVGAVIWNLVGAVLLESMGWRTAYLVFGCVSAASALVMVLCLRSYPADVGLEPYGKAPDAAQLASEADAMRRGVSAKVAFGSVAFVALAIMVGIANITVQMGGFLPTYVYHLNDEGTLQLGSVVMAASLAQVCIQATAGLSKVVLGAVADRSIYAAVMISFVGGVAGILVCWMCPYSEWLIYGGALLFGLFFAACDVLGPTVGRYIFGPREFTHIYSRIVPIATVMAAIGVSGFATLSQLGWPIMFAAGVATGTIGVVAGVLAIRFGKRLPQTVE